MQIKPNHHYTRRITPKRVRGAGLILGALGPG